MSNQVYQNFGECTADTFFNNEILAYQIRQYKLAIKAPRYFILYEYLGRCNCIHTIDIYSTCNTVTFLTYNIFYGFINCSTQ